MIFQTQLKAFLPKLMRIATGKRDWVSNKDGKPEWWPPDTPWSYTKAAESVQQEVNTIFMTLELNSGASSFCPVGDSVAKNFNLGHN